MKTLENLHPRLDEKGVLGLRGIMLSLKKMRMSTSVNSNPNGSTHQPEHFNRPQPLSPPPMCVLRETGFVPPPVFPTSSYKPIPSQSLIIFSPGPHQGATAEQNHEDDEGLKPIVLHNEEAGFPQDPPRLA